MSGQRVPAAEAISYLAAHHPDRLGQALIDLLQAGQAEAFRRPDGDIAFRIVHAGADSGLYDDDDGPEAA